MSDAGRVEEAPGIEIVTGSLALADSFHACLDAVARERRWLLMLEAPPLDDVRAFVERMAGGKGTQVFAVEGDRVVGWCDIHRWSGAGMTHGGTLGMGLLPEYRGRGVGRRLLEECLRRTHALGTTRVELQVWASNDVARRLYERCGFEHEGVRRRVRFLDGAWDDLVLMARLEE